MLNRLWPSIGAVGLPVFAACSMQVLQVWSTRVHPSTCPPACSQVSARALAERMVQLGTQPRCAASPRPRRSSPRWPTRLPTDPTTSATPWGRTPPSTLCKRLQLQLCASCAWGPANVDVFHRSVANGWCPPTVGMRQARMTTLPAPAPRCAAGCTAASTWLRLKCPCGSWPSEGWGLSLACSHTGALLIGTVGLHCGRGRCGSQPSEGWSRSRTSFRPRVCMYRVL